VLLAWPRKIELLAGPGDKRKLKDMSGRTKLHPAPHREQHPARTTAAAPHKGREQNRPDTPGYASGDHNVHLGNYSWGGYPPTCEGGNANSCMSHLTRLGLDQRYAGPRCSLSCLVISRSVDRARGSRRAVVPHSVARRAGAA
jgi:hypothetical protein